LICNKELRDVICVFTLKTLSSKQKVFKLTTVAGREGDALRMTYCQLRRNRYSAL
jgi:hypothetical protein